MLATLGVTVTEQVDTPGVAVEDKLQVPVMLSLPTEELTDTVPVGKDLVPLGSSSVTVTFTELD